MAEVTPPGPGEIKEGGKGAIKGAHGKLKKVPKWAWIAGAVVFVGVAYLSWKRSQNQPAVSDVTDPSAPTDQVYPAPTQGAFGGANSPIASDGSGWGGSTTNDPYPILQQLQDLLSGGLTVNMPQPLASGVADGAIPFQALAAPVTGGGAPVRAAAAHEAPPKPVTKNGKFYHVYNYGKANEKWVYVRPASTAVTPARGSSPLPQAMAPQVTAIHTQPTTHPGTPTGGGMPAAGSHIAAPPAPPKPVVKNGKFYHVYNYGTAHENWVYVRPAK